MTLTESLLYIAGGVALLLFGLRMLQTGLQNMAGVRLKGALGRFCQTRLKAYGCGLVMSVITQSSTATGLMTSGFVRQRLIAPVGALAVILGAELGSTLLVPLFTLSWASYIPALLVVGVACRHRGRGAGLGEAGRALLGFTFMVMALNFVHQGAEAWKHLLQEHQMGEALWRERWLIFLLGIILTWLFHSSLAMVLLSASLYTTGALPLSLAVVLVLAANIGHALPNLVLHWHESTAIRRVTLAALAHSALPAFILMVFEQPLLDFLSHQQVDTLVSGNAYIVLFHIGFNVLKILWLPFLPLSLRFAGIVLPDKISEDQRNDRPLYLDTKLIETPHLALAAARREALRLGGYVETMLQHCLLPLTDSDSRSLQRLKAQDEAVDALYETIKLYCARILQESSGNPVVTDRTLVVVQSVTLLEHIGDVIDTGIAATARKRQRQNLSFSEAGLAEIKKYHQDVCDNFRLAMHTFLMEDKEIANQLIARKPLMRKAEETAAHEHLQRIRSGTPESVQTIGLHTDIIRDLRRINSYLTGIAYQVRDQKEASEKQPVDNFVDK